MASLIDRDKQFIWHPFTPQKQMPDPIAIVKGSGSLLFDEMGNSYIDAISSWWVNLHGHAHPYIAEKIYQQALTLEQVIFAGFTHSPAVNLAERLLPLLPGSMSRIFYSDNGSTSTEVALKMALQYWWNLNPEKARTKILCFENSYHGDTFGAMSVSDRSVFTTPFVPLLFDVITIPLPNNGNLDSIKSIIHQYGNDIAAFIYEPMIQGAGGMNMYDSYLMNELLNSVKLYEVICVADEVMTGFGRTGTLFASEHYHKKPDIICLSKGLTGGTMALGVTACNNRIYNAFVDDDKRKTFFHGHSFTANPLACTAALASLDLLQQQSAIERIEWLCNEVAIFAKELINLNLQIQNVRVVGTVLAFEMQDVTKTYLHQIAQPFTKACLDRGVYIRPLGNTVYIMPPYCVTESEFKKIKSVILEVIKLFV
ncbi:MAG: adenosylmethionine--8-amino-7-oxononanoate transaminase [Sediminibacterium sp.]|jgi:adenosylmethionine-8-amino-7-oxononanoate aminotransferase|nr:adenosylmethionine--8-amino-7-oxononanoate transaminase [Sediminibacterium sp.]